MRAFDCRRPVHGDGPTNLCPTFRWAAVSEDRRPQESTLSPTGKSKMELSDIQAVARSKKIKGVGWAPEPVWTIWKSETS
jgi:hypothetical protein